MIDPKLPSGFRDYLPSEMIQRQAMLDIIRGVYETFGFSPLETPAVERREVLVEGDSSNIIYDVRSSESDEDAPADLALRFDLTVPMARVVAANLQELPRPFRRYQCAKVWRGERPQLGRFREFLQFDADIVGAPSGFADAEMIWLAHRTMTALGLERFLIRFSSRKVLDALVARLGLAQGPDAATLLRTLDKVDKIGQDGVERELAKTLPQVDAALVRRYLATKGSTAQILAALPELLGESDLVREAAGDLAGIAANLVSLGVNPEQMTIDLSIVRGLGYYTGMVFETILLDMPELGSVYVGGRYDGLVSRYSDARLPSVGVSIGFDRLYVGLEKLGLVRAQRTVTRVLILRFDDALEGEYVRMLRELRDAGIPAELYVGEERSFKAQLNYGLKLEIPLVVIFGADDAAKGTLQLKDTRDRSQDEVSVAGLLEAVRGKL